MMSEHKPTRVGGGGCRAGQVTTDYQRYCRVLPVLKTKPALMASFFSLEPTGLFFMPTGRKEGARVSVKIPTDT